jgi:hypothetical protein
MAEATARFQEIIDDIESLPLEDQAVLVDIVRKRIAREERARIIADVVEARAAHANGDVRRGSAQDLMAEIGE